MKLITAISILLSAALIAAAGLKDSANNAFIAGDYEKALYLYDSLAEADISERVHVLQMKASLYEEYLGEIDSALIIYSQLLDESGDARLKARVLRRVEYLKALYDQKEQYGLYQRTLVSRIDPRNKITAFEQILSQSPDFIKKEEILRLLTTLYHDQGQYREAYRVVKRRIAEFGPVEKEVETSTRRYARREFLHYLSVAFILVMLIVLALLFPSHRKKVLPQLKPLLFSWFLITLLFAVVYYVKIADGFYNPFVWYSPWVLMGLNILPILWLVLFTQVRRGKIFNAVVGVGPALFSFFLLFQIFLYSHKKPMALMDTFLDRQLELFTSEDLLLEDNRGED